MNGIPAKKINSRPQNWISLIKFVENRSKQKVRLPYCNLYAYAANNPVKYTDPDGNFFSSYWANYSFNKYWEKYINQYEEFLNTLNKNAQITGNFYFKVPVNNSFDKAVLDDYYNSKQDIIINARNFAVTSMGYEENSEELNDYIESELSRYNKLQKLRISKENDGSYKSGKVDQILDNAWKIYEEELSRSKKEGLDTYERYRNAENKANEYIDQQLTEEGF